MKSLHCRFSVAGGNVVNQCPGKAWGLSFRDHPTEPRHKAISIRIIGKNFTALDTAADDVLKRTWCIYSGFSRHTATIAYWMKKVTQQRNPVPLFLGCGSWRIFCFWILNFIKEFKGPLTFLIVKPG